MGRFTRCACNQSSWSVGFAVRGLHEYRGADYIEKSPTPFWSCNTYSPSMVDLQRRHQRQRIHPHPVIYSKMVVLNCILQKPELQFCLNFFPPQLYSAPDRYSNVVNSSLGVAACVAWWIRSWCCPDQSPRLVSSSSPASRTSASGRSLVNKVRNEGFIGLKWTLVCNWMLFMHSDSEL